MVCDELDHSENNSFLAFALTNDCIGFPMPQFLVLIDNGRTFFNAAAEHPLILSIPFAMLLPAKDSWNLEYCQWQLAIPKHVVQRFSAYHRFPWKQLMQPGIADTGIQ